MDIRFPMKRRISCRAEHVSANSFAPTNVRSRGECESCLQDRGARDTLRARCARRTRNVASPSVAEKDTLMLSLCSAHAKICGSPHRHWLRYARGGPCLSAPPNRQWRHDATRGLGGNLRSLPGLRSHSDAFARDKGWEHVKLLSAAEHHFMSRLVRVLHSDGDPMPIITCSSRPVRNVRLHWSASCCSRALTRDRTCGIWAL